MDDFSHDDEQETPDFHRRETLPAPPDYPEDIVLAAADGEEIDR